MADQHQTIDVTLRQTLDTLSEGIPSTTPDQGANLIDVWLGIVRNDVATQWVAEPLEKLRDALNSNDMRTAEVTMRDLAGITFDLANNAAGQTYQQDLQNLSTALNDFARGLFQ